MRYIYRFACVAALLLFARQLAQAQNAPWFEVQSDHFRLFTDTSAAKGRQLLTDFEARVSALEKVLGPVPQRQFPVEVFLFKNTADFMEVGPTGHDVTIDKSAYLFKGPDRFFIAARDKSPDTIANDIGHGLGHVFFERYGRWRPFWLAEGAAELFRTVGRDPDRKRITPAEGLTAPELLKAAPSADYKDAEPALVFRAESNRLLHIVADEHASALRAYMEALRTEEGGQAKLELEDASSLTNRLYTEPEARTNLPSPNSEMRAQNANATELAIHRGDLFLATNKTSDAARYYNADSAPARGARAVLTRFSRNSTEATRALDRAARELPDNGLVQFHFGSIETTTASDQALQATALERAVKLLPQMGRAYAELARLYTVTGKPDAALPLLDRALQLEPEYADHVYELRANALLALGRSEDVRKTVQIASALPHSDHSVDEVYDRKMAALLKKLDDLRHQAETQRVDLLRTEVATKVAVVDPPKPPAPPPPEPRHASVNYSIEATAKVDVVEPVLFPTYPDALVQAGTAGKVTLQVNVGANGKVTQATVTNSQIPEMNAASIDAAKKWVFKPVLRAGQPAPITIKLVFEYLSQ
jgi:TonB family protein